MRANDQYRSAVDSDIPRVRAISAIVKPGEEPEFDDLGSSRLEGGEPGQGLVERQQLIVLGLRE